jgi:hypothetical protein
MNLPVAEYPWIAQSEPELSQIEVSNIGPHSRLVLKCYSVWIEDHTDTGHLSCDQPVSLHCSDCAEYCHDRCWLVRCVAPSGLLFL